MHLTHLLSLRRLIAPGLRTYARNNRRKSHHAAPHATQMHSRTDHKVLNTSINGAACIRVSHVPTVTTCCFTRGYQHSTAARGRQALCLELTAPPGDACTRLPEAHPRRLGSNRNASHHCTGAPRGSTASAKRQRALVHPTHTNHRTVQCQEAAVLGQVGPPRAFERSFCSPNLL